MKKMLICIFLFSMVSEMCFSQISPDFITPNYAKGMALAEKGNWNEAFIFFKEEADKGNAAAQYQTAMCYAQGEGVTVNFQKAFNYMYKAATSSTPWIYAYEKLGYYYLNGLGCSQNCEEAIKWYQKGATSSKNKANIALCIYQMGILFLESCGAIQKDYTKAVSLFKIAAEFGRLEAAHNLGYMYDTGTGVEKDALEAVTWYRKAAELGSASSQYNLGMLYLDGREKIPVDKSIALLWLKKAAAQGHTKAIIKIAELEEK